MSAERPIIFNADMVRAVLDGRKTQTRRPLKTTVPIQVLDEDANTRFKKIVHESCPMGKPGDRLWVRETLHIPGGYLNVFEIDEIEDGVSTPQQMGITYRADGEIKPVDGGWRPSIHMPRWASRILLEITDIRVERVQDISEAEAIAEGIYDYDGATDPELTDQGLPGFTSDGTVFFSTPKYAFEFLWQSIYGPDAWDRNDWVWVIEFKRVEAAQ